MQCLSVSISFMFFVTEVFFLEKQDIIDIDHTVLSTIQLRINNCSPRNSPRQSAIPESFAEANCFYSNHLGKNIAEVIISQQNIHIQFTIFNTYFSTKFSFTNKRYRWHVLQKCLYVLQEVRSIIYVQQFIHPFSSSRGNGASFAFTSYSIVSAKFCNVKFLNNFYFVSFFYHLFICRRKCHAP